MINKFFYIKDTAKRDILVAADRFNGLLQDSADSLLFNFNNLGNDQGAYQGVVTFDINASEISECIEEIVSASAKHPFTVIVDEITKTSVSSRYVAGGTSIVHPVDNS